MRSGGKAEIEKPPDMVTIQFTLVTHDADQGKANAEEVQSKSTKILTFENSRKIDEKDVIAAGYQSERARSVTRIVTTATGTGRLHC